LKSIIFYKKDRLNVGLKNEIDQLVYQLYNLSKEEINIVEGEK